MFLLEAIESGISTAWLSLILGPFGALVLSLWVGYERKKEIKRLQDLLGERAKTHEEFMLSVIAEKSELLEKQLRAAEKTREALASFARTLEALSQHMEKSNGIMAQAHGDLDTLKLQWARFEGREEGKRGNTGPGEPGTGDQNEEKGPGG